MKRFVALLVMTACLLVNVSGPAQARPFAAAQPPACGGSGKLATGLLAAMAQLQSGGKLTVIVKLTDQAELAGVSSLGAGRLRGKAVIERLQQKARASPLPLTAVLHGRQAKGDLSEIERFWIFNGLAVTATPDAICELAALQEVASITPNETNTLPPVSISSGPPEPNLSVIHAPTMWQMGFRGQGVVVASMDSGVDIRHPALSAQWRGGTNSWFDPYGQHPITPTDTFGHGTETMGVMVGRDTGGTAIGVAPDAQWIAVKVFNDANTSTTVAIHQAFQWLLDPDGDPNTPDAPQVVNASWAYAPACNLEFQPDLQALRAAGILPVFSAGNYGPSPSTSTSPANYPEAVAVGGTDNSDNIAGFSSRGPSSCGASVFPSLVAPAVNIRTAGLNQSYVVVSGTSFSAPHVTGAIALLLSAYPSLSMADQETALLHSAVDLGAVGPDPVFGYGRLDVLAAWRSKAYNLYLPIMLQLRAGP